MASRRPRHNAPAGQEYESIRDAGKKTLETYCDKYPTSKKSFILPNIFKALYPDNIDEIDKDELEKTLMNKFIGLTANLEGERAEYEVFNAFNAIVRQSPDDNILVFFGFKLDHDNGKNIKRNALKSELPHIKLNKLIKTTCENDFIVFIRNVGVVFAEVKTTSSDANLKKAEAQLLNIEAIVQSVWNAVAPDEPELPTARLIIIPGEITLPSPTEKTAGGSHVIFNDVLDTQFPEKWVEIVNGLKQTAGTTSKITVAHPVVNADKFAHTIQLMTGIWTMRIIVRNNKKIHDFVKEDASEIKNIKDVDKNILEGNMVSKQGAAFTEKFESRSVNDVFQNTEELNLLYLSPEQMMVFHNYRQALIRAHAGCGKSVMILFKILDLVHPDNDPEQKQRVLLVAPYPHDVRCVNILRANNVTVEHLEDKYPYLKAESLARRSSRASVKTKRFLGIRQNDYKSISNSNEELAASVVVISVKNFFHVSADTLDSYDVSGFNVFFDDLHSLPVKTHQKATYEHIYHFIEETYRILKANNLYAWFGVDAVQGGYRHSNDDKVTQLIETSEGNYRHFNIPVVTMRQVLRNSKDIINVLQSARAEQINKLKINTSNLIDDIVLGHHITSVKVVYHTLNRGTAGKYRIEFLCERLVDMLEQLFSTSSTASAITSPEFDLSNIAILVEEKDEVDDFKPEIEHVVMQTCGNGVVNIKEQSMNRACGIDKDKTNIVLDAATHVQSFECAVVVYVRTYGGDEVLYNAISRARTKCVIVDIAVDQPPLRLDHVDYFEWREKKGVFSLNKTKGL